MDWAAFKHVAGKDLHHHFETRMTFSRYQQTVFVRGQESGALTVPEWKAIAGIVLSDAATVSGLENFPAVMRWSLS